MKKILLFILIISATGCSPKTQPIAEFTLKPLTFSRIETIDNIVDSIKIIRFDQQEKALMTDVDKILITTDGNFILQNSNSVKYFTSDGSYISDIGRKGKGPGEYLSVSDMCLTDNNILMLSEDYNKVHKYDLNANGKHLYSSTPKWDEESISPDGIIPVKNSDGYYLFTSNPPSSGSKDDNYFCLHEFDNNDNDVNQYIKRSDYIFRTSAVTQFDFQNFQAPTGTMFDKSGNLSIEKYLSSNYYKFFINFFETKKTLSFEACGPNAVGNTYFYSPSNSVGCFFEDLNQEGSISPFHFIASDSEFIYGFYNIDNLNDIQKEHIDPITKYVFKQLGATSADELVMIGLSLDLIKLRNCLKIIDIKH